MRHVIRGAVRGAARGLGGIPASYHFITEWDTTGASETVTLPATSVSNDFTVDWGDGSALETVTTASPTHVYVVASTYNISILGSCPTWSFNNGGDKLKIKDVKNWGRVGFTSLSGGFWGCVNMTTTATDTGDFSNLIHLLNTFRECSLATPKTANWDVSSVTTMQGTFTNAVLANPDVSNWDVSSTQTMQNMFSGALLANPDVSNWDVSSVTLMSAMFFNATSANPDISSWAPLALTDAANMFSGSIFGNANYDTMLAAWSLLTLQSVVTFHAGIAKYTEAAARLILTDPPNSWTITDGGAA